MGILLGALLVGALFYLASIGDAILWREQAQNAADAGAFSNAVWHARGMNLIVGINIVMSLVLSVFALWRLAIVVVALVTLIMALLSWLGVTAVAAGAGAEALATMITQDFETVAPTFRIILSGMNVTEIAVASYTPTIAAHAAAASTNAGYRVSTSTYSASMLPNANIASVTSILTCFTPPGGSVAKKPLKEVGQDILSKVRKDMLEHLTKNRLTQSGKLAQESELLGNVGISGKMGLGFSLPVQTDRYSLLCRKALEFVPRQFAGLWSRVSGNEPPKVFDGLGLLKAPLMAAFGLKSDKADGVIDKVREVRDAMGSIVFCVPIDTTITEFFNGFWNIARKFNADAADRDKAEPSGGGAKAHALNILETIKEVGESWGELMLYLLKAPSDDTQCGAPAAVWDAAANGDVYMRSTAVVLKPTRLAITNAGIEIADGKRTGNLVQAAGQPIWAHAEMYFDCSAGWYECRSDAMWQLRWTARLRRVQPFGELLAHAEADQPGDSGSVPVPTGDWSKSPYTLRAVSGALAGLNGIPSALTDLLVPPFEVREIGDTRLFSSISGWGAHELFGHFSRDSIREFIRENSHRNSEIH